MFFIFFPLKFFPLINLSSQAKKILFYVAIRVGQGRRVVLKQNHIFMVKGDVFFFCLKDSEFVRSFSAQISSSSRTLNMAIFCEGGDQGFSC